MDQDAGYTRQGLGPDQQLVVGEPGGMGEVVRDQAGETETEAGIVVAGIAPPAVLMSYQRLLPIAPGSRRRGHDVRIRGRELPGVGGGEVAIALVRRQVVAERFPFLR